VGVTVVAVLAARADPAAMVAGWNVAAALTAAIGVVGALVVFACRPSGRALRSDAAGTTVISRAT
jgi:hypothetical protein